MLLTLTARHFSERRGRAYPVTVRHPQVLRHLWPGMTVRIWHSAGMGEWVGRRASCVEEVVEEGDGRCFVELREIWLAYPFACDPGAEGVAHMVATIWISLPGDVDPRTLSDALIVELEPTAESNRSGEGGSPGPLLILGPQRSGTTALQVALHLATRYAAPADINRFPGNTLEGFHAARILQRFVSHPLLSCFGADSLDTEPRTGLFDDSALADWMIDSLADHLRRAYSLAASVDAAWTDKCPGWEAAAIGPLFASLFPGARIVFMTRDPVACVLSIVRLESRLPASLDDADALHALARNSAAWVCTHLIWRRYGRPRLRREIWAEVPFSPFRENPAEVMPELARVLSLNEAEQAGVLAALKRVPLPRHAVDFSALDPRLPALIARLCLDEARRWGYALAPGASIEPALLEQACGIFQTHLAWLLRRHSIRAEVIREIVEQCIAAARSPDAPPKDETPAPPPGLLLSARLSRAGSGSAQDPVSP